MNLKKGSCWEMETSDVDISLLDTLVKPLQIIIYVFPSKYAARHFDLRILESSSSKHFNSIACFYNQIETHFNPSFTWLVLGMNRGMHLYIGLLYIM